MALPIYHTVPRGGRAGDSKAQRKGTIPAVRIRLPQQGLQHRVSKTLGDQVEAACLLFLWCTHRRAPAIHKSAESSPQNLSKMTGGADALHGFTSSAAPRRYRANCPATAVAGFMTTTAQATAETMNGTMSRATLAGASAPAEIKQLTGVMRPAMTTPAVTAPTT